jgi:DNA-binding transcriptional ArsR family regulator
MGLDDLISHATRQLLQTDAAGAGANDGVGPPDDDADGPSSPAGLNGGGEVDLEEASGDDAADTEEAGEGEFLPTDIVFGILRNARRRFILRYLDERGEATLGELAEEIAAEENDKSVDMLSSYERKRVYVSLYQCHLPKLENADVIESDRNLHVELGPNADQVLRFLDVDDEPTPRWHAVYGGLSAVGLFGVGLWLAVPGLTGLGTVAVASTLLGILSVSAANLLDDESALAESLRAIVPTPSASAVEEGERSVSKRQ